MANFAQLVQGTLPPDTGESPTLGAQRIREVKDYLAERFSWVYGMPVNDSEADATLLGVKTIPFGAQGSDPSTPIAGKMTLYAKTITPSGQSATTELFMIDDQANVVQVTSQGALNTSAEFRSGDLMLSSNTNTPTDGQTFQQRMTISFFVLETILR